MAASAASAEWRPSRTLFALNFSVGISVLLAVLYGGYYIVPEGNIPLPQDDDLFSKLLYTLRCFLFPGALMLVAISKVGLDRGKVGALNPLTGNEDAMLLSKKRLVNTLEQLIIYCFQALFLTTLLEKREMKFVFLYTLVFVIGRLLFWIGYGIDPKYRGAGMVVNFISVVFVQGLSAFLVCFRHFLLGWWPAIVSSVLVPSLIVLPVIMV